MSSRAGDGEESARQALEELYVRLERPLYNVVHRWLWDAEESRDVVHDAFLRLWSARERVRWDSAEPLAYRIALNLAANRRRARRLRRVFSLEALRHREGSDPGAQQELERQEAQRAVREAMDALPERLRRVVALCDIVGMSYEQASEVLGIPAGTVGSRRHAALRALRTRLGEFAAIPREA